MAFAILKILVSLFFAIWSAVLVYQFFKDHDDDDTTPPGAVAA